MKLRHLLFLLLSTVPALATALLPGNECVPNTLARLGELYGGQVTPRQFSALFDSPSKPTSITNIYPTWTKMYPRLKLQCVYSPPTDKDNNSDDPNYRKFMLTVMEFQKDFPQVDAPLKYGHKYLWIGIIPKAGMHCCLVRFDKEAKTVTLTHSQLTRDGKYYETSMSFDQFFGLTVAVIDVVPQ